MTALGKMSLLELKKIKIKKITSDLVLMNGPNISKITHVYWKSLQIDYNNKIEINLFFLDMYLVLHKIQDLLKNNMSHSET